MSIFDWFNPARWLMLLALCGSLTLGYFSWRSHERDVGEQTVQVKWDKANRILQTAADKATLENKAKELAWAAAVTKAKNEAEKRAKTMQANAAAARAESMGLRDDLAAARGALSNSTCTSVTQYATTLSGVFDQCVGAYQGMASKASGHASDAQTLTTSWPK